MKIDLHCHTARFSPCGLSAPEDVIEAAIAVGLDGIVLTEHDVFWPEEDLRRLNECYPSIAVFGGAEVSTPEGHLLIYGTTDPRIADCDLSLPDLLELTDAADWFRAIAHPFRFDRDEGRLLRLSHLALDAVEVASMNTDRAAARMADRLARVGAFPGFAASDAHVADNVGRYYTVFDDVIQTEADLVRALRSGRFHPSRDRARAPFVIR